jgi:hypothetical protein
MEKPAMTATHPGLDANLPPFTGKPATLPVMGLLAVAHVGFWSWGLALGIERGTMEAKDGVFLAIWLIAIGLWLAFVARLSRSGWLTGRGIATDPWAWIPLPPIALTLFGFVFFPEARAAWLMAVSMLPAVAVPALMSLRILAIGTVIKARNGDLPRRIGYAVGIPDFVFGMLSLGVAFAGGFATPLVEIMWHLTGAAILMLMLPMVFTVLHPPRRDAPGKASGRAILAFPMVLAPAGLATLFLVLHALRLWQLLML